MSPIDRLTIRPAILSDAPAIAQIHVESWRVTYDGLLPRAYLDSLSVIDRESRWARLLATPPADPSPLLVAVDNDQVIGFVNTGPAHTHLFGYPRELYVIHVLKTHQRQGVGRLLTAAAVDAERQRGTSSLMLWCFTDNLPARSFYDKIGGVQIGEKHDEFGGKSFPLVAYGWTDLTALAQVMASSDA